MIRSNVQHLGTLRSACEANALVTACGNGATALRSIIILRTTIHIDALLVSIQREHQNVRCNKLLASCPVFYILAQALVQKGVLVCVQSATKMCVASSLCELPRILHHGAIFPPKRVLVCDQSATKMCVATSIFASCPVFYIMAQSFLLKEYSCAFNLPPKCALQQAYLRAAPYSTSWRNLSSKRVLVCILKLSRVRDYTYITLD